MRTMFLIGQEISHSLSPAMWNHLFERTGRPIRYGLRDVDANGLARVLEELGSGSVLAANVTMPHKAWAASIADELDDAARNTGAVNLLQPGSAMIGSNTDVSGARALLEDRGPFETVLVLGAGGTATALLESLVGLVTGVVIANRTGTRADTLAASYAGRFAKVEVIDWEDRDSESSGADLVVNTVPMVATSPVDVARLKPKALVYDVMYRNEPTALQQAAAERGLLTADGLAHLAAQAIASLTLLGFDQGESVWLTEGLELATKRPVIAWGEPLG
jgi:shikimate dehydrogenase